MAGPPEQERGEGVTWDVEAFDRSLGRCAPATVRAYRGDLDAFAEWAGRAGSTATDGGRPAPAAPATSPTSPRGATSGARSPARRPRCAATSTGAGGGASSSSTRHAGSRPRAAPPGSRGSYPPSELERAARAAPGGALAARPAPLAVARGNRPARRRRPRAPLRLGAAGERVLRPRHLRRSTSTAASVTVWGKGDKQRRRPR